MNEVSRSPCPGWFRPALFASFPSLPPSAGSCIMAREMFNEKKVVMRVGSNPEGCRKLAGDNVPGQELEVKFAPAGAMEFITNNGS